MNQVSSSAKYLPGPFGHYFPFLAMSFLSEKKAVSFLSERISSQGELYNLRRLRYFLLVFIRVGAIWDIFTIHVF